ncbi:EAL domain-containing protein [Paraburkholderia sp. Cpub6]|uniref:EAL domain-containing protein n=1 Tax=Paraburkholderia sp. Cpub6 TaxID=2723094 RepID=UPI0016133782|nr:EAL domain-containing protein [Paraburkholderia sp. Cpub6]MBB5457708.1 EAL domain-containing protein (putative c-di-GMP-specific phosphodiesterase class I) [Paraburkholderia sp. Cpub6]
MPTPLDVLIDDGERFQEASQLYSPNGRMQMAALQSATQETIRQVIDLAYQRLCELPNLMSLIHSLSELDVLELKSMLSGNLIAIADPHLTAEGHLNIAHRNGRRNAMIGLGREDIARSFEILLASLRHNVDIVQHAVALSLLSRRMIRDLTLRLQAYDQLQSSRSEVLKQVTRLAWTADSYTNLISEVMPILGAHDEVAGCSVGRPDSHGVFRFESVFGANTEIYLTGLERDAEQQIKAGDEPQGKGPTGLAWINRRIERCLNIGTDPKVAPWRSSALAAGFRSSVALPLCTPTEEPRAILTLYSGLPGGYSAEQRVFAEQLQSLLAFAIERIENRKGRSHTIPYLTRKRWAALLRSDCLEMHYQPILDLRTGATSGIEALARLRDGDRLIAPGEFLPVLTSDDLLALFFGGLRQAMEQVSGWMAMGFALNMAINLPPSALADTRYFDHTLHALRAYSFPPQALTLEILETDDIPGSVNIHEELTKYKRLGVRLAQDDLGAGYSSLARLRSLPADSIKIDRGIVSLADNDATEMLKFVYQLTRLGHSLGKSVTVEGVEDIALLEAAAILGADLAQGFGIARPMSALQLTHWLSDGRQPSLPDITRPSSRLGKLAQLLVWEESMNMLASTMSDPRKVSSIGRRGSHNTKLIQQSEFNLSEGGEAVDHRMDALLEELSIRLPVEFIGATLRTALVSALSRHGVQSPQYLRLRRELVGRIANS